MNTRRPILPLTLVLAAACSGCFTSERFSVKTNLPATACPALRAAGQANGWQVVEPSGCASLELAYQGRLIFEAPDAGEVHVTLHPPERRVLMNEITRLRALMKQDAERIVIQAEQTTGTPPPQGVGLRVE